MNLQRSRTPIRTFFFGVMVLRLIILGGQSLAQTNRASTHDPLNAFVGTWVARAPGEKTPFLVLKLHESSGKLIGTMSHFKIRVIGNGTVVGSPEMAGESPITDLTVGAGDLGFVWVGDPLLRGNQARFVVEGTTKAFLVILVSSEQIEEIMADNPGARGFNPVISMRREVQTDNETQRESTSEKWEVTGMVRLINTAEAQFKFAKGRYADYPTLLRSGQLKDTGGREFTVLPKNFQSETDPLPGYRLRLWISTDGSSYELSILERTADCGTGLFSDETGMILEGHALDCPAQ